MTCVSNIFNSNTAHKSYFTWKISLSCEKLTKAKPNFEHFIKEIKQYDTTLHKMKKKKTPRKTYESFSYFKTVTVHKCNASFSSRARCLCVCECVWACRLISADQRSSWFNHHHQLQLITPPLNTHHFLISFVRSLFVSPMASPFNI